MIRIKEITYIHDVTASYESLLEKILQIKDIPLTCLIKTWAMLPKRLVPIYTYVSLKEETLIHKLTGPKVSVA